MDNWNSNCEPDGTVMSITDLSVLLKKNYQIVCHVKYLKYYVKSGRFEFWIAELQILKIWIKESLLILNITLSSNGENRVHTERPWGAGTQ